jgi:2-oxoglutarate ferredoxin oxidoreductase subunit alpha
LYAISASGKVRKFLDVEFSMGQMLQDVKLSVRDPSIVDFLYKLGGLFPATSEIEKKVMEVPVYA